MPRARGIRRQQARDPRDAVAHREQRSRARRAPGSGPPPARARSSHRRARCRRECAGRTCRTPTRCGGSRTRRGRACTIVSSLGSRARMLGSVKQAARAAHRRTGCRSPRARGRRAPRPPRAAAGACRRVRPCCGATMTRPAAARATRARARASRSAVSTMGRRFSRSPCTTRHAMARRVERVAERAQERPVLVHARAGARSPACRHRRAPAGRAPAGAEDRELAPAGVRVIERPPAGREQRVHAATALTARGLCHRAADLLAAARAGRRGRPRAGRRAPSSRARVPALRRSARRAASAATSSAQYRGTMRSCSPRTTSVGAVISGSTSSRRCSSIGRRFATNQRGPASVYEATPSAKTLAVQHRDVLQEPRGLLRDGALAGVHGRADEHHPARRAPDAAPQSPRRPARRSSGRRARAARCPRPRPARRAARPTPPC